MSQQPLAKRVAPCFLVCGLIDQSTDCAWTQLTLRLDFSLARCVAFWLCAPTLPG